MSGGVQMYREAQRVARSMGRGTDEILMLYCLERFLGRLSKSAYKSSFALKGGVLLAAYDIRRPTSDIDVQVLDVGLTEHFLRSFVAAVAGLREPDGVVFDTKGLSVESIRDEDEYQGLRVRFAAYVDTFRGAMVLDVSTGDPITPAPARVVLGSVLPSQPDVVVLGHPLVNVVAEKTVTMVQRASTNTRWRDFLDVRLLAAQHDFEAAEVWRAVDAVAKARVVAREPSGGLRTMAEFAPSFNAEAQAKWVRWTAKHRLQHMSQPRLMDQVADVARFIDPIFARTFQDGARWDRTSQTWV